MPGPGKKIKYSGKTGVEEIRHYTLEELRTSAAENATAINEVIEATIINEDTAEMHSEAPRYRNVHYTAEMMEAELNNKKKIDRYERAYEIYYDKFGTGAYTQQLISEANAKIVNGEVEVKTANYNDASMARIANTMINTNATSKELEEELITAPNKAKSMANYIQSLMEMNVSNLFSEDPDEFLDFAEEHNMAGFLELVDLNTIFGGTIFEEGGSIDDIKPDSRFATEFMSAMTEDQIQFVKENFNYFYTLNHAGGRLIDMATPFDLVNPSDPYIRSALSSAGGIVPMGATFSPSGIEDMVKGTLSVKPGTYESMNVHPNFAAISAKRFVSKRPELMDKGYVNADFTGYMKNKEGKWVPVAKEIAIEEYDKKPKNVQFKLNAFGLKMQKKRLEEKSDILAFQKTMDQMEERLSEIYGSKKNASPEFNALATEFRTFRKNLQKETEKFSPNLEKMWRDYQSITEKADLYIQAKMTDIAKGKPANEKRKKRMLLAADLKSVKDPLIVKHTMKKLRAEMKKSQVEVRTLVDSLNPNAIDPEGIRENLVKNTARLMALETVLETIEKNGKHMDYQTLTYMADEKFLKKATDDFYKGEAFKDIKNEILTGDDDQVEIRLQEIAASKSKNVVARIGVNDMHKEIVVKSMNLTKDEKHLDGEITLKSDVKKEKKDVKKENEVKAVKKDDTLKLS